MEVKFRLNKDFERAINALATRYGEKFEYINGLHESQLDYSTFLSKFIDEDTLADSTIDPNANANHKDIRSFMTEKSKPSDKLFALSKIFYEIEKAWGLKTAQDWLEQEFTKGFYLNDSSTSSFLPYCYAVDLSRLAREGLFFLTNYNNQPPKHLTTFLDDVIEFVSFLGNRQSGAVGLPNIIVWSYYFWKHDVETGYYIKTPEYYLRQCFEKLIYRLNQPFLRLDQSAFTNFSIFDRPYLENLFGGTEYPDGTFVIDQVEEIIECEKVCMEVISNIRSQQMFTYPVLTFSLLKRDDLSDVEIKEMQQTHNWDLFVDNDFAKWASNHNIKWSDSNFFVSEDVGTLSNCCRLLSSTTKLEVFQNSIGGSALSIGSCRVSTINLVRIAHEVMKQFNNDKKNIEELKHEYIKLLKDRCLLDCKALTSMRHILKRNIEKGLMPNYQDGALELEKQYCTIGIAGMYEVIDMFGMIDTDEIGNKTYSKDGLEFACKILDTINDVKDSFECDFSFNVEAVPGENLMGVLATADRLLFGDDNTYIYANQWIPLIEKCTIQEKCKLGGILDAKCGGGCIAHINIEGRFPNEESAWDMLNQVASNNVIYFAFNTKINVCKHKHSSIGTTKCPICGEDIVDQFTRVVGFYTPVSNFQAIRKKEFDHRKWYNVLGVEKHF